WLHYAQIDLQPAREPHRRARIAPRGDLGDFAERAKALDDGCGLLRRARHHDVEVADRLLAAPEAARDFDLVDATAGFEVFDVGAGILLGVMQHHAPGSGRGAGDALTELFEQLGAEPGQLRDLSGIE